MDETRKPPSSSPQPAMVDTQPPPSVASYIPSFSNLHTLTVPALLHGVNTDPQAVVNYILTLEARVRHLEKRIVVHHNTMRGTKDSCDKMARQLQGVVEQQEKAYEKSFREMRGLERIGVLEEGGEMVEEEEEGWGVDYGFGYGDGDGYGEVAEEYEGVGEEVEVEDRGEGLPDYVSEDGEGGLEGYGGGDEGALEEYGMQRQEIEDGALGQDFAGEDAEMDVDEEEEDDGEYADIYTPPSPPSPSLIRG